MKTSIEKALDFVNNHPIVRGLSDAARSDVARAVNTLLQEQDRDTRHSCAAKVCEVMGKAMSNGGSFPLGTVAAIEQAIMNVKAV